MGRDHPEQPKQIGNSGRDLRGWAVLCVGIPILLWSTVRLAAPTGRGPTEVPSVPTVLHQWKSELVGERLALPPKDDQGYPIPRRRGVRLTVVAVPCSSCSNVIEDVIASGVDPIVLFVDGEMEDVPRRLLNRPSSYLVVCRPSWGQKNRSFVEDLPQAAIVDSAGTVIAVPRGGQTLGDFLRQGAGAAE